MTIEEDEDEENEEDLKPEDLLPEEKINGELIFFNTNFSIKNVPNH